MEIIYRTPIGSRLYTLPDLTAALGIKNTTITAYITRGQFPQPAYCARPALWNANGHLVGLREYAASCGVKDASTIRAYNARGQGNHRPATPSSPLLWTYNDVFDAYKGYITRLAREVTPPALPDTYETVTVGETGNWYGSTITAGVPDPTPTPDLTPTPDPAPAA
jgi:hypothetical protein